MNWTYDVACRTWRCRFSLVTLSCQIFEIIATLPSVSRLRSFLVINFPLRLLPLTIAFQILPSQVEKNFTCREHTWPSAPYDVTAELGNNG